MEFETPIKCRPCGEGGAHNTDITEKPKDAVLWRTQSAVRPVGITNCENGNAEGFLHCPETSCEAGSTLICPLC